MAKPRINSAYNYQDQFEAEITLENKGETMTVPNEVDSIQQILKRMAAGNLPPEGPEVYFDMEIDQISKYNRKYLDLTELEELKQRNIELAQLIDWHITDLESEQANSNSQGGEPSQSSAATTQEDASQVEGE